MLAIVFVIISSAMEYFYYQLIRRLEIQYQLLNITVLVLTERRQ